MELDKRFAQIIYVKYDEDAKLLLQKSGTYQTQY